MRLALLFALLPTLGFGQSPAQAPHPEDLGTVTGHITCADTQRPARFATVSLIPTKINGEDTQALNAYQPEAVGPIHTDLNGSYTLTDVPPGQYYLRVDLYGYATPLKQFTPAELVAPTPEIQQRMQRDLQVISVKPNSTTEADVTLHRSGSITGRITYDDGSPVITTQIAIARRDTSGKFGDALPIGYESGSHGEYEIVSLSAGEYIVQVKLGATEQQTVQANFGDGKTRNKVTERFVMSLPVYSASAFRPKAAAIIKVEDGRETPDVDITIPISRLHEVSGTLIGKDGQTINDGQIELLYSDTREQLETVQVHEDGTFRLPYVPEGDYIIAVNNARDRTQVITPISTGSSQAFQVHNETLRTYGTLEQPLLVQTDIQSLNLIVPDKPPSIAAQ